MLRTTLVLLGTLAASALALIGCCGRPSAISDTWGFICSQISLETVIALPFKSIENGVMICALVP